MNIHIDELVATFIEAGDQKLSLFNYVNELNNEVEKLEVLIAHLRAEIERHRFPLSLRFADITGSFQGSSADPPGFFADTQGSFGG